jgi:small subunit ribosomal protein S2
MRNTPTAILIVDPKNEAIAINEALKLRIPIIALADTNCDPDGIDYLIPGNDDAIRSIRLICNQISESILAGKASLEGDDASDEAMMAAMSDASEELAAGDAAPAAPAEGTEA